MFTHDVLSIIQKTPGVTVSKIAEQFNISKKQVVSKICRINVCQNIIRKVGEELFIIA